MEEQQQVEIIFPDEVIRDVFVGQYAYRALAKYNRVLLLENENKLSEEASEFDELCFVYNDYKKASILQHRENVKRKLIFCYQGIADGKTSALKIIVNKGLAEGYLKYQLNSYHLAIYHKSEIEKFLQISGYSFYNINFVLRLMFFNNLTIEALANVNQNSVNLNLTLGEDELEQLFFVLQLKPDKIDRELINELLEKEYIQNCIEKKYFFCNGPFWIGNIELYLKYSRKGLPKATILDKICGYIDKNPQSQESSLLDHMIWIASKLESLDSYEGQIKKIEKYLFDKFRFTEGGKLLEFIKLTSELLEKGSEAYIIFQVNSANIYMDREEYKTAETILDNVLELSRKTEKIYYYVMDERVRLFERTERYAEALVGLYQVERYYTSMGDFPEKIRNVRNRIGENLYFTGEVRKAKGYLEKLFFGAFQGKTDVNNILSCEIANNLSLCYLEEGSYEKAIELMDSLYKTYLRTDKCPANYATDILQNKGSVYLNMKDYREALRYFELALRDEKNPYSKQLILENYMYAKAMDANDFTEGVLFFEEQCKNTISDETKRMLAEMYYGAGLFEQCVAIADELMPDMKEKKKLYDLFALSILRAKSKAICGKMGLLERIKTLIQLECYKTIAKKIIGEKSFYYNELKDGIKFLKQERTWMIFGKRTMKE